MSLDLTYLLIDHIRREAIFFRASLVRLQEGLIVGSVEELIQSELFWLRIMADHSKFILHLLDPSERRFVDIQVCIDPFALTEGEVKIVETGAFKPFGTISYPGEVIKGELELRPTRIKNWETFAMCPRNSKGML